MENAKEVLYYCLYTVMFVTAMFILVNITSLATSTNDIISNEIETKTTISRSLQEETEVAVTNSTTVISEILSSDGTIPIKIDGITLGSEELYNIQYKDTSLINNYVTYVRYQKYIFLSSSGEISKILYQSIV